MRNLQGMWSLAQVKKKAIEKIKKELTKGQQNIFMPQIVAEAEAQYDEVVASFKAQIIEIPRMDLVLEEVSTWFEDFDLDISSGFELNVMQEEIIRMGLKDQKVDTLGVRQGAFVNETPCEILARHRTRQILPLDIQRLMEPRISNPWFFSSDSKTSTQYAL